MRLLTSLEKEIKSTPVIVGSIYALLSIVWIFSSDYVLASYIKDPATLTIFQTLKGWFFVTLTAFILYKIVKAYLKKIEKSAIALAENEDKYRTIMEQSSDGIIISDINGKILEANSRALNLVGYTKTDLENLNVKDLIFKEDLEQVPLRFTELLSGQSLLTERRLVSKDNEIFTVEINAKLLSNNLMLADVRDITERKKIETELRESEEQYRLLFKNNPHPMWVYNLETLQFLAVNNAAVEKYGFSTEQFLSMTIKELRPPEDIPALLNNIETEHGYYQISGPWQHRKKDGTIIFVDIISTGINFQGEKARLVLSADITERKAALEALKLNEQRYRSLFEQSPISIWEEDFSVIKNHIDILKQTGVSDFKDYLEKYPDEIVNSLSMVKILDVNQATVELFEASGKEEILNNPLLLKKYFHFAQKESIIAISEGRKRFEIETEGNTIKGNKIFISLRWAVAEGYENSFAKVLVSIVDITKIKLAEEALIKLNEELEERVKNRTVQLEAANKELEAFAYSISHDLRSPLRRINGFLNILFEENASVFNSEAKNLVDTIIKNILEMEMLIDAMLSFSKFISRPIAKVGIDMKEIVNKIINNILNFEKHRSISIKTGNLPFAFADNNLIQQVWQNYISNALKFTRTKETAEILIDGYNNESEIIFKVSDNGVGFNQQYAYKLFDVFQRLHSKEQFEGSGVGLAIVKRIVKRHGGRVWAEGELDKGATFYFSLPKQEN